MLPGGRLRPSMTFWISRAARCTVSGVQSELIIFILSLANAACLSTAEGYGWSLAASLAGAAWLRGASGSPSMKTARTSDNLKDTRQMGQGFRVRC